MKQCWRTVQRWLDPLGSMRRVRGAVLAGFDAVLAIGAPSAVVRAGAQPAADPPPVIRSTFQSSTEGWKVVGDPVAGYPVRNAEGPNGFLRTADSGGGSAMYWSAPAKFVGDKTAYSGGLLEFDLRQGSS